MSRGSWPERRKAQVARWRAEGRCTECGGELPESSESCRCQACRDRRNRLNNNMRLRYDDHPEMIALCMNCKYEDCVGRCPAWTKKQRELEKREPDFVSRRERRGE